ncbi:MAG: asparaginase [Vicingaceae bacterium]
MKNILLIYTGGTIGMVKDDKTGSLFPFNFDSLLKEIPELKKFELNISHVSIDHPIDSSDMQPSIWVNIAEIIETHYDNTDGFVILHGSDTMAFTASALSFMLEGLAKPVILTGSQLPIGVLRTDAKENILSAIEIAASDKVQEVAIYFEYHLIRGNRATKVSAEEFNAFMSPNYPYLAEAGVHLRFNHSALGHFNKEALIVKKTLDSNIAVIKFFPGISEEFIAQILNTPNLKGLVIESFGAGNIPQNKNIFSLFKKAIDNGLTILNISQCLGGGVEQGKYMNSKIFNDIGVISGHDLTFECAVTKMMFALGNYKHPEIKEVLALPIRGEMSNEQL